MKDCLWSVESGLFLAGAAIAAGSLWCAWRLAGEPFYAACAVFVAAFWGSMAALAVWARLADWSERRDERDWWRRQQAAARPNRRR